MARDWKKRLSGKCRTPVLKLRSYPTKSSSGMWMITRKETGTFQVFSHNGTTRLHGEGPSDNLRVRFQSGEPSSPTNECPEEKL
jgi:hypothetical protein